MSKRKEEAKVGAAKQSEKARRKSRENENKIFTDMLQTGRTKKPKLVRITE